MNLAVISVPRTSPELIEKLNDFYYHDFYLEMIRMSNANLNSYVDQFLEMLIKMTTTLTFDDTARVSIGVMCLHMFGFRDFQKLASVFDRVLPQTEIELVKFTSYCAGMLIHHPSSDQARYTLHLCERAIGWVQAHGRRRRLFAAARLLSALAANAGNSIISFLPTIKVAVWKLMACDEVIVLNQNAAIVKTVTVAIDRYARGDLEQYLRTFDELCRQLLDYGSPIKTFAGLEAYRALISNAPDFFVQNMLDILNMCEYLGEAPAFVKVSAVKNRVAVARVDQKSFQDMCGGTIMGQISELLFEDPKSMTKCLRQLLVFVPEFVKERLDDVKGMIRGLMDKDFWDYAFQVIGTYLVHAKDEILPFCLETMDRLLDAPLTVEFKEFFTTVGSIQELLTDETKRKLSERLCSGLKSDRNVVALQLIAELPNSLFTTRTDILELVTNLASHESYMTRCSVPGALFNVAMAIGDISGQVLMERMLKKAVFHLIQLMLQGKIIFAKILILMLIKY